MIHVPPAPSFTYSGAIVSDAP